MTKTTYVLDETNHLIEKPKPITLPVTATIMPRSIPPDLQTLVDLVQKALMIPEPSINFGTQTSGRPIGTLIRDFNLLSRG